MKSRYLLIVSMDVDPDKEELFNELYNKEHVPALSKVPGVLSAGRFVRQEEVRIFISGESRPYRFDNEPKYSALYELESPDVMTSKAWAEAVDRGRWAKEIRPYTRNRRQVLLERIYPE